MTGGRPRLEPPPLSASEIADVIYAVNEQQHIVRVRLLRTLRSRSILTRLDPPADALERLAEAREREAELFTEILGVDQLQTIYRRKYQRDYRRTERAEARMQQSGENVSNEA
jgi:hypothetical protein